MLTTQLNFDEYGNLTPYKIIEVDLTTFEAYFVTAFPNSTTRKRLFENYLRYVYRFQDEVFPFFEQWINGSFVTYEKRGNKTLDKFWTFSLEDEGIDSYLVRNYPQGHPKFHRTIHFKKEWKDLYGTTRDKIQNKGFLKITFEK